MPSWYAEAMGAAATQIRRKGAELGVQTSDLMSSPGLSAQGARVQLKHDARRLSEDVVARHPEWVRRTRTVRVLGWATLACILAPGVGATLPDEWSGPLMLIGIVLSLVMFFSWLVALGNRRGATDALRQQVEAELQAEGFAAFRYPSV